MISAQKALDNAEFVKHAQFCACCDPKAHQHFCKAHETVTTDYISKIRWCRECARSSEGFMVTGVDQEMARRCEKALKDPLFKELLAQIEAAIFQNDNLDGDVVIKFSFEKRQFRTIVKWLYTRSGWSTEFWVRKGIAGSPEGMYCELRLSPLK